MYVLPFERNILKYDTTIPFPFESKNLHENKKRMRVQTLEKHPYILRQYESVLFFHKMLRRLSIKSYAVERNVFVIQKINCVKVLV